MRKLFFITLLVVCSILFTTCKSQKPEEKSWDITIRNLNTGFVEEPHFSFLAKYNSGSKSVSELDEYTLIIDSLNIPVEATESGHDLSVSAEVLLSYGQSCAVTFSRNESVIFSGNIKIPNFAFCNYPESFNPTQQQSLSWTLSEDNQQQQIYLCATSTNIADPGQVKKYISVSSNLRSYTIPAGTIPTYGENSLGIVETNYYNTETVHLSTIIMDSRTY